MAFEVQRASKRLVKREKGSCQPSAISFWLLGLLSQICAEDGQLAILNLTYQGVKPARTCSYFASNSKQNPTLSGKRPSYAERM